MVPPRCFLHFLEQAPPIQQHPSRPAGPSLGIVPIPSGSARRPVRYRQRAQPAHTSSRPSREPDAQVRPLPAGPCHPTQPPTCNPPAQAPVGVLLNPTPSLPLAAPRPLKSDLALLAIPQQRHVAELVLPSPPPANCNRPSFLGSVGVRVTVKNTHSPHLAPLDVPPQLNEGWERDKKPTQALPSPKGCARRRAKLPQSP